ncbi:YpoC family protein [Sporosarcina sp. FSL W8-0480]|uniref:YpoC family protein n=1 Tax=Sporosarcina sp. FSL W8-0480 TaxID=2954701 RepID=UPI0030D9CFBA
MPNSKTRDYEVLNSYWEKWLRLSDEIRTALKQKDPKVVVLMESALQNYTEMLSSFILIKPATVDDATEAIEPLNGHERLQFIREKMNREFAFIQLKALYSEAQKKAVSLLVRSMIKSR